MMAPKGRKSVSAWNLCENCKVIVSQKDLAIHVDKSCPPLSELWIHGYIKDKFLCGVLEEVNPQDGMKNIPKSEWDNVILLSDSALQLCDIGIGEPVVVSVQGVPVVKIAWPTLEKSLVSVLLTRSAMDLHWGSSCGGHVTVKKLSEPPVPAGSVSVQMTEKVNSPVADLAILLQGKHRNRILKIGDRLHLQHYGRNLKFVVKRICPIKGFSDHQERSPEAVAQLTEELHDLNLSQDSGCEDKVNLLFVINEVTKWNIEPAGSVDQTESSHIVNNCSLSLVGGLQNVIEEIREIIQLALRGAPLIQGLPVVRGILLYGVPGTGKTMLAEAVAAESPAAVVRVSGAEIYSKFLGETEARLRQLFRNAEEQAPSIVLLDEC